MAISKCLWSTESAKAIKAQEYGALNAIMYLAPADVAGVGNLCPNASDGCKAACLALYSDQASMVADSDNPQSSNKVRASRIAKSRAFMRDRAAFMAEMALQLAIQYRRARAVKLRLVARPNGGTDIPFEVVKVFVSVELALRLSAITKKRIESGEYRSIFALFPFIQFNDYTKSVKRMRRYLSGQMPPNYHLTFSRAENNAAEVSAVIKLGGNVAVVFDALPFYWQGVEVIDGDLHDLRYTDPKGVIVGLMPKGRKAKRDNSGFIVRTIQN